MRLDGIILIYVTGSSVIIIKSTQDLFSLIGLLRQFVVFGLIKCRFTVIAALRKP